MFMQKPIIAIDGTAASGKGTLARRLAAHLGYACLDTGLLYRRVAMTLLENGLRLDNHEAALETARTLDPDGLNDPALRSAEAGRGASIVAAIPEIRQALIDLQRNFPSHTPQKGAILDGRDIGTVIFPDAVFKFYVDADISIRAQRRYNELRADGSDITYETVLEDMKIRDARDSSRADAPMRAAPGAVMIDTSFMTQDQVFDFACRVLGQAGLVA
jgi:cytidylate kinase